MCIQCALFTSHSTQFSLVVLVEMILCTVLLLDLAFVTLCNSLRIFFLIFNKRSQTSQMLNVV